MSSGASGAAKGDDMHAPDRHPAIVSSEDVVACPSLLQECTLLQPSGPFVGWSTVKLMRSATSPSARASLSQEIAKHSFGHVFYRGSYHTRQRPVFFRLWIETMDVSEEGGAKSINVDMFISAVWRDEAMVGVDPNDWRDEETWEGIWDPLEEVALLNEDGTHATGLEKVEGTPGFVSWEVVDGKAGLIRHRQRFRGEIRNRMRFELFPFDSDTISIVITALGHRMKLYYNWRFHPRWLGMPELNEWVFGRAGLPQPASKDSNRLRMRLGFQRAYRYYFINILLVAFMLMVMSFSSYSIPMTGLDALNARMAQATTLFLAMVAFLFVTKDKLPKVSCLTVMDEILLSAFLLVWVSGLESWVVYELWKHNMDHLTWLLDRISLIASPAIFAFICVLRLSTGFWRWSQFRAVMVACETAVTVMQAWVESLGIVDQSIIELAQFRERVQENGDPGDIHAGIVLQVYNAVKMHELQTAFKVVELKRRVAAAMRHIVDSHEHIYRDWDPRDRLLSQGGANYFKLSRYWSAFSVRGYASRCFEKIAKEVFDGEEIPVANVIAREEDKLGRASHLRRTVRRWFAATLAFLTLGLSTIYVPLDLRKADLENGCDRAAVALEGGAKRLEAQEVEEDEEGNKPHHFNKVFEAETDDKGRLTGKTAMRMDPFDQKRDERAFWSALVPILQSKRLQMEPVWPVLQRLTREGVAQSKAVAKVGCRVTIAPRWFEAAGVGQLGCLAPGVSGTVVHVMMHKSLPVVVKSDTNGAYWFYKTAELVGAGLGLESRGDFLPGMVVRFDTAVRGLRVVLSDDREDCSYVPPDHVTGTLVQRGENSKWWKVLWDDGTLAAYCVGEPRNDRPRYQLALADPPLPATTRPQHGALVTLLSLPAAWAGMKVMPGPSVARKGHGGARGMGGGSAAGSQPSHVSGATTVATAGAKRKFRRVEAGAVGTVLQFNATMGEVLVEWDVDLQQWEPLAYGCHLVFAESTPRMPGNAKGQVVPADTSEHV